MIWRVVAASEIGTSHVTSGAPCEDSCWAQVDALAAGESLLSIFVSDGAGSASHGGEGAELAIQAAADFLGKKLKEDEFGLSDALAVDLVVAVRESVYAKAEAEGLKARDFACTFLGALSSARGTLVMQIGDGGVVVDLGKGLELAIVPMSGEYANMTHFVTDEDAVNRLVTKTYNDTAQRVAVFSDGLQRLALNMAENTVRATKNRRGPTTHDRLRPSASDEGSARFEKSCCRPGTAGASSPRNDLAAGERR